MNSVVDVNGSIQRLLLEKLRIQQRIIVPSHMLDNTEIHAMTDFARDQLIVGMSTYVTAGSWTTTGPNGDVRNYWVFPEIPPNPDRNICQFLVSYYGNGKK